MSAMPDASRAAFEAWFDPNDSKNYWDCWQSSREQALEEAAKEFDHRAEPATGFYEPHEPAEIIRSLT